MQPIDAFHAAISYLAAQDAAEGAYPDAAAARVQALFAVDPATVPDQVYYDDDGDRWDIYHVASLLALMDERCLQAHVEALLDDATGPWFFTTPEATEYVWSQGYATADAARDGIEDWMAEWKRDE